MSGLPPGLAPPENEAGFALVFQKQACQWFIHLWSNQVTACEVHDASPLQFEDARTYKFVLPATAALKSWSFYRHGLPTKQQRALAVEEHTRQVAERLEAGFVLQADSRLLKPPPKVRRTRRVAPARVKALKGWAALKYWGTRFEEANDPAFKVARAVLEKETEAAVKHQALSRLPSTSTPLVSIKGDVRDSRFSGTFLYFPGDLHVTGSLELGVDLYVGGHLTVDGVLKDSQEWTHFLVGGDLTAGGLDIGSQVHCTGRVTAPFVVIDGTGELVARELKADLLVEEGFDHAVRCIVKAKHRVDFRKEPEVGLQVLERVLEARLAAKFRREFNERGEDFYFEKDLVIEALKSGRPIWKSPTVQRRSPR